ncbi:MAG: SDR family NAD(P)-dependent oxidoreductase [Acidobacteria bacterium]|nr:SDR family NAD(P)-dependent oxidoreductase [Acidobacteriota bacterium]
MFSNMTIVVTGGTGALGSRLCELLIRENANVHATYIVDRELDYLSEELASHARFHTHRVALTEEQQVIEFFDKLGTIDGLCAIAGGFDMASTYDTTLEAWQRMFQINVTTAFLSSREALRHMDHKRGGRIVAVGSYSVVHTTAGMAAYRASKAAVLNLVDSMAEETLHTHITVNAVLPTILDTPANRNAMPDADYSKWVSTQQAAETIAYLLRPDSGHITGACIPLRGRVQ